MQAGPAADYAWSPYDPGGRQGGQERHTRILATSGSPTPNAGR
jgi:hypothetical protein